MVLLHLELRDLGFFSLHFATFRAGVGIISCWLHRTFHSLLQDTGQKQHKEGKVYLSLRFEDAVRDDGDFIKAGYIVSLLFLALGYICCRY